MVEPILKENKDRFVIFPIKHHDLWEWYKKCEASFWTAEEIDLHQDLTDWKTKLNDDERYCDIFQKIKNNLKNKFIVSDDILITRERHRQHLQQCLDHLNNFNQKKEIEDFDIAAEDLRLATRHLGMIVGKVDVEEILGSIFNDFCIGK